MTIIVYRAGEMAADSGVIAGYRFAGTVTKLVRNAAGDIAGAAGPHADCHRFREWFAEGCQGQFVPNDAGDIGFGALMIDAEGNVTRMDRHGTIYPGTKGAYHIEGCAEDIAAGALEHGATAREAVEIVCRVWLGCAGPVCVERLDGAGDAA